MILATRRTALALVALAPLGSARAGLPERASAWVEGHRSRVRLVDGGAESGVVLAALEMALAPGFKTYWRTPGDSGVPPTFDWSASSNVAAVEPAWPAPRRFEDAGGVSYGYLEHLVLPLRVTPRERGAPIRLAGEVDYGVCKDICVPARAALALPLSAEGPPPASVAKALARVPERQPIGAEGPLSILSVQPNPGAKLGVRVRVPDDADPVLFPEAPDNWFLAASAFTEEPRAPGAPRIGTFAVEVAQRPREPRSPVDLRFTLVAGKRAIETSTSLDAADLA